MMAILKQSSHFLVYLFQNLFYHQWMVVENILDRVGKANPLSCRRYKYLLFLFDLKDIKDRLVYLQLLHLEIY